VAVQDFGAVGAAGGGGAVRGPAPLVDDHIVVEQYRAQPSTLVLPPSARWVTWCTSQAEAGWSQPPAQRQCWSRRITARRTVAGISALRPTSSGRLGPASRAPSCRVRRNEASPPGPETRSTALPIVVLLHIAVMSTSTPRRTGGRTLIDLDPGQLKWILLARESTDRERQPDNQLADLRARVASIGGMIDREIPENAVSAFKRKRVELPDGTYGFRVVRPEWEKILTALRRGECNALMVPDIDRATRDPAPWKT
jgi:hypothetical protein